MNVEALLDRLQGVRKTGPAHWIARCPAHRDRTASLSIDCGDDGRILLHDFAGCTAHDVLAAVGLTLGDLFPERLKPRTKQERLRAMQEARRQDWAAATRVLAREAAVLECAATMLASGNPLSDEDRERLRKASVRIDSARRLLAPRGDRKKDLQRLLNGFIKEQPR